MSPSRFRANGDSPLLLLWDIDHTLIENGGVCRKAMTDAFLEITGQTLDLEPLETEGCTDLEVMHRALLRAGIQPTQDLLGRFVNRLGELFAADLPLLRERGRVLGGVERALSAVGELPDVFQTVVTGNIRANAVAKLAAFGLDAFIACEIGGYGSDRDSRSELVVIARERAEKKIGMSFDGSRTLIIGDTLRDIDAARENGAGVIAVATGRISAGDLRFHGADIVLSDLRDTTVLLDSIRAVL